LPSPVERFIAALSGGHAIAPKIGPGIRRPVAVPGSSRGGISRQQFLVRP